MPIYNLYKEREGTARRGEDYKEAVIEYMEGLNYMVERDSAFHSTLDDIQFVNSPWDFYTNLSAVILGKLGK